MTATWFPYFKWNFKTSYQIIHPTKKKKSTFEHSYKGCMLNSVAVLKFSDDFEHWYNNDHGDYEFYEEISSSSLYWNFL